MFILGISCFYHASAASLIYDGKIIAACEEERFSRIKHDYSFPEHAIASCLRQAGIETKDLDFVVFYEKPFVKFERSLLTSLEFFPFTWSLFVSSMKNFLTEKLWIKAIIVNKLKMDPDKILFVPHHLSHAASAYYPSPFQKTAFLVLDGVGEWTTGSWGIAEDTKITPSMEMRFPNSLGLLYSTFTSFLGFRINDGEYKVMGLAPFGSPRYAGEIYRLVDIAQDGSLRLNLAYFSFHKSTHSSFSEKFIDLFGKPRSSNDFFKEPLQKKDQYYADIASSIQQVTEEIIVRMCHYIYGQTNLENLCFAGGVALNSVANSKITRETQFRRIFVQPAAGDDGGALGAALYTYHHVFGGRKRFSMNHALWGESYRNSQIEAFLQRENIHYQKMPNNKLISFLVDNLIAGKVIGYFEGRSEWGPRALGARSILADPRSHSMKKIVNEKIKFREPFRPFAPSVLEEHAEKVFAMEETDERLARFMLGVVKVRSAWQKHIPAVTHVDGSARVHMVPHNYPNKRYRDLLKAFYRKTNVPVLLNTSFNLAGEPIVQTPQDAYKTFMKSGIDILVLENLVLVK